ncbi:alpha/beta hydrolase [Nocardiopsis rhodophaea]
MAISFLIATTQEWADAVEDYKDKRQTNIEKWNNSEKQHLETIRKARANDLPAGSHPGPYTTKLNPWIPDLDQAIKAMREDFNDQMETAKTDWRKFQKEAEKISDKLKQGATEENVRKLQEAGYLAWAPFNIMGAEYYKPELPTLKGDVPKQGSDPEQVNAWWEGLTPSAQEELKAEQPDRLRMMDGIPVAVRDELNRHHLDQEIARLKREGYTKEDDEYQQLTDLRDKNLDEKDTERYLLGLDTSGDVGRAIVADGNPETANNVATLVPGTGIKWPAVNGQLGRASALKDAADNADSSTSNSVISWIGYDTPGAGGALMEDSALTGANDLHDFQSGLQATRTAGPANTTVVGHSYGSTVIGQALQEHGLDADNYVFVGSPGVKADHVSDLGVPGSKVHVSTAKNDGINSTPDFLHGTDPTEDRFGATEFKSDDGSDWEIGDFPLGEAHGEYFEEESSSLKYMGDLIAGRR